MRRFAALLPALLVLTVVSAPSASAIVGGKDADQPYPFMASLQLPSGEHFCGGSLVAATWVLTAAHCVEGRDPGGFSLRIGSNDRTQGGEVRKAESIIVNAEFDPKGSGGDIALVELASPADAQPIETAPGTSTGMATRLLGWGQTCPEQGCGGAPVTLQQLDTTLTNGEDCSGPFDPDAELCTGNPDGDKGACYGDSGGPEIVRGDGRWLLAGLSSRPGNDEPTCATGPSIYTSAVAYTHWINKQVNPQQNQRAAA